LSWEEGHRGEGDRFALLSRTEDTSVKDWNIDYKMSGTPQKMLSMSLEEETLLTATAGNNESRYCASGKSISSARNEKARFDLW
jgi:hypothetical protein